MNEVKNAAALLRVAERRREANEAIHDQTPQRQFELRFESRDLPDSAAARADASDRGKSVRQIVRQLDADYLRKVRELKINRAAAQLPRSPKILRQLLWAIYRNGSNRGKTMSELSIGKSHYWWGVKFLLKFYSIQ